MFAKFSLAAAVLALVPFATADFAEAARGDGARNGQRTKQARTVKNSTKKKFNKVAKNKKKKAAKIVIAHSSHRISKDHRPYRHNYRAQYAPRFKCVAVGKRRGGYGRRIPGIRAVARGGYRKSCRRALRRCRVKLNYRKARGRNPFASCVVARRVVAVNRW